MASIPAIIEATKTKMTITKILSRYISSLRRKHGYDLMPYIYDQSWDFDRGFVSTITDISEFKMAAMIDYWYFRDAHKAIEYKKRFKK